MSTKSRIIGVVIGALVTLALGAIVPMIVFQGCSTLSAVLAAFLCSLIGGYLATRLAQVRGLTTGALSGLAAGLVMLLIAAVASSLAANTTLAAVLLMLVWAAGGASGGWLTRVRVSLEK